MPAHDVIVVGAGPAGLSAALEAAGRGLGVLLLDEQASPGGQIYRALADNAGPAADGGDVLGEDYWRGGPLVDALGDSGVDYVPGASVWTVERDPLEIGYVAGDRSFLRSARHIIVATGAYERPVPVPGWTLPGVMTAGAAQILMKAEGAALTDRIVLAGCGPLLMLVTCQLLRAGAQIVGLLETTRARDYLSAAPYLPLALGARETLRKGLAMRRSIKAGAVPTYPAVRNLRCLGAERFEAVAFESRGRRHELEADLLLLHQGVVPHVQISRLLDLDHEWVGTQRYWRPILGDWGETSSGQVHIAGDCGGIEGARVAEASGRIAGLDVAAKLGAIPIAERDRAAAPHRRLRARERCIRPLLERLYPPPEEVVRPSDPSVVVCRCEEVEVAEIRACIDGGCAGPNQLKAYSRCGMGPCQGRMCGLPVSEIIAEARAVQVEQVGYYRVRPPIKPVPLSALAALETDED